jgi:hypothetical protein
MRRAKSRRGRRENSLVPPCQYANYLLRRGVQIGAARPHAAEQFVIDKIMKMKKECGYEDFAFLGWFELGGFEGAEIEEQMQIFAEEVMPVIARECGGKVDLPAVGLNLAS